MTDETLIHYDGLRALAAKAAAAHETDLDSGNLNYEKFGVCTYDLLVLASGYAQSTLAEIGYGLDPKRAVALQFMAGFDIGYQARLEVETRELAAQKDAPEPFDIKDTQSTTHTEKMKELGYLPPDYEK